MNFHISPLHSPLRPRFSSPSLGPPRHDDATATVHDTVDLSTSVGGGSGPVRIQVDSDSDTDDTDDDVTQQDSRDVLVQRLTDLAAKLSAGDVGTSASSVEALHKQVDAMESVLLRDGGGGGGSSDTNRRRRTTTRNSSSSRRSASRSRSPRPLGESSPDALGMIMGPSWFVSHHLHHHHQQQQLPSRVERRAHGTRPRVMQQQQLSSSSAPAAGQPKISCEVADTVVKDAEELCAEMATVIESLQTRRKESDHLHEILVQREELLSHRVREQTAVIGELEDAVADNEAELRHLKLELRAIEVQAMPYVPEGADPQLRQSIRNWKHDWRLLREKCAARRGSSFVPGSDSSTLSSLASPTGTT